MSVAAMGTSALLVAGALAGAEFLPTQDSFIQNIHGKVLEVISQVDNVPSFQTEQFTQDFSFASCF